jgi:benzylsuccinate CoA-transferase BbsF subunit
VILHLPHGPDGALETFAGYGNLAAAISGFSNLGGWPDHPPAGPFSAYTDYVSRASSPSPSWPRSTIADALAGGSSISRRPKRLHFLAPALLDYGQRPRQGRSGNRSITRHGMYRSRRRPLDRHRGHERRRLARSAT